MAYFDWNATTPLLPEAKAAWLQAMDSGWGNPSTAYRAGARAKLILDNARGSMAGLLHVRPEQIIFTSGATESNNAFIRIASTRANPEQQIWISAVEHPAVREAALHWWGKSRVVELPVTGAGLVDLDWISDHIAKADPALICVMAVNNETGIIQPIRELHAICSNAGIQLFSDAVQWFGKVQEPFSPYATLAGFSLSAHKFGGPKGTGCLVLGDDWTGSRLQVGGGQEFGSRAGTEDVAGITAMATALENRMQPVSVEKMCARDLFEKGLNATWPGIVIHGKDSPRIWNTCSVSLPHYNAPRWIARLDKKGFQVSTGAACSAGKKGPSRVMLAMGVADDVALRTLRISSGWETEPDDWKDLLAALVDVHSELSMECTGTGPGNVIQI